MPSSWGRGKTRLRPHFSNAGRLPGGRDASNLGFESADASPCRPQRVFPAHRHVHALTCLERRQPHTGGRQAFQSELPGTPAQPSCLPPTCQWSQTICSVRRRWTWSTATANSLPGRYRRSSRTLFQPGSQLTTTPGGCGKRINGGQRRRQLAQPPQTLEQQWLEPRWIRKFGPLL